MSQILYWQILLIGELYLEWRSCKLQETYQSWFVTHQRRKQIFFCFGQLCGVFRPYWPIH